MSRWEQRALRQRLHGEQALSASGIPPPVQVAAGHSAAAALPSVQVSDIKRANGMLADNAMFGKDTLLIPTRPLPVG